MKIKKKKKEEEEVKTYSVEAAPRLPELKLSIYLTHRCSKGTVVPPEVTHTILLLLLPPAEELRWMKALSFWTISSMFLRGGDDSKKELTSSSPNPEMQLISLYDNRIVESDFAETTTLKYI